MAAFHKAYPGIDLELDVANRERLIQLLVANSVDMVLMGAASDNVEVESEAFMQNPLVVVAPPNHPLSGEVRIPLERLAQEIFVMREPGSGTRLAMERFFQEHRLTIRQGMQMTRNEAIKAGGQGGTWAGYCIRSHHRAGAGDGQTGAARCGAVPYRAPMVSGLPETQADVSAQPRFPQFCRERGAKRQR